MRAAARTKDSVSAKTPTNVSLDASLVAEAKGYAINVSQACEQGLAERVRQARERAFLAENRAAIEASNAYVEEHGLPLAHLRPF